jgi:hypothetical protein
VARLKVVRVGKPSGVSESLWPHTLDAAIERDPNARRALEDAARITAKVRRGANRDGDSRRTNKGSISAERAKRDAATDAGGGRRRTARRRQRGDSSAEAAAVAAARQCDIGGSMAIYIVVKE